MKLFTLIILLVLFCGGCNKNLGHDPQYSVNPVFQGYVEDFQNESDKMGKPVYIDDLVIKFSTRLESDTLGQCSYENPAYSPTVLINQNLWQNHTEITKKVVLFHELGHCILHRGHDETFVTVPDGMYGPKSIMHPYMQNDIYYSDNWSYYAHEMFYAF